MPEAAVLTTLAERKKKLVAKLHTDIKVDHWDLDGESPVYVRYGPVSAQLVEDAQDASLKAKDADGKLEANAELLVEACKGVFQKVDGKAVGFDGKDDGFPKFDADLAKILGVAGTNVPPTAVCRALFLVEGNLLAHASEVVLFSGHKLAEVDTELLGE